MSNHPFDGYAELEVVPIEGSPITRVRRDGNNPFGGSRKIDSSKNLTIGSHTGEYTSYSGVDIVATLVLPGEAPVHLGELQTISYSTHRENAPVRILGNVTPVAFVRGARTIAGSMIFTVFNSYAFYKFEQYRTAIKNGLYPMADMLPPFDIVLTFANEYGIFSKMKLLGVTFIDEGGTMSIDDLITEATFSYMARGIQPLTGYVAEDAAAFFAAGG